MTYREVLGSVAAQKIRSPGPANEVNWKSSMLFCQTLSDAIDTYGTSDLPNNFFAVIEPFVNSMLECAISERTQLSVQACRAVGNLAKVLSKDMHPLLDRILPVLIRHCASTKAVNQKSSAAAIATITAHSTYNPRLLWHICQAFEEKNVGPRLQAPAWLSAILQQYPNSVSSNKDVDMIVHSIHMGLVDADNNVRTKCRALFWEYSKIDTEGAEEIKSKLNTHALTALENDPHNPNQKSSKPKPKSKDTARPDSSLAQMRKQAKQRLQEHAANATATTSHPAANQHASLPSSHQPSSVGSANFTFGEPELEEDHNDNRSKKPSRDVPLSSSQRSANNTLQPENHHISKPASRPISVHKKTASNDASIPSLGKKLSAMDINNHTIQKKPSTSEGLRTSQNKKTTSSAPSTDSSGPRSLLSGPVRRPRIVATPINAPNQSSRPSSRTGPPQTSAASHEQAPKQTKDALSHTHVALYPGEEDIVSPTETHQPLQQIKSSRKALRQEVSSPVVIPDGKENASVYASAKSYQTLENTPTASHVQRVLDHATKTAEAAQLYIAQQDAATTANNVAYDNDLKAARKALNTAIDLMQSGQLDYMGFRKLKNIVCNHGSELINDQDQYNTLLDELIPRLGQIQELVYRGDPRDMKHPTYIRQAVLHMVVTLLKKYHPTWSERYMGAALATMMLARCAYSRNTREYPGERAAEGQTYMYNNTTVELIMDAMQEIIIFCPSPLEILSAVLEYLGAAEAFLLDNVEELEQKNSANSTWRKAWASWDRYSKEERLKVAHMHNLYMNKEAGHIASSHLKNLDGFKEDSPELPSKLPFLMETALRLVTPLLMKARTLGHKLYPMQEELLGDLGQHLLTTYNALIRRQVMPFCEQLYLSYSSETQFWEHFPEESDRNLLHYYLADLNQS